MVAEPNELTAYLVLAEWCTTTKTWLAAPSRYDSPRGDRTRLVPAHLRLRGGQCALEPFALVGNDWGLPAGSVFVLFC